MKAIAILVLSYIIFVPSAFTGVCPDSPKILPEELRKQPELLRERLEKCELQAKQGNVLAQRALSNIYCSLDYGRLSKVTRTCVEWYRKARLAKWADLEKNLGEDLRFAIAWTLDKSNDHEEHQEGRDMLKRIAIHDDSAFDLVHDDLYRQYEKVAKKSDIFDPSLQEYVRFITDVASVDDDMSRRSFAQMQLSMLYANGIGVVADLSKSQYWMSRAGASGGKYGIEYIKMIKLGFSAPPDHQLAEKLFNKFFEKELKFNPQFDTCSVLMRFASLGFSSAMYQLSESNKKGQHKNCKVDINLDKAKSWKDLADKYRIIEHKN
jgi:TPR repeat protein